MVYTEIDVLVHKYLREHPDYEYPPSGDRHPNILAMTSQMKPWIMDQLGGAKQYWLIILRSAKLWFMQDRNCREYKIFCARFESEGNTFWNGRTEFEDLSKEYLEWRLGKKTKGAGGIKF